MYRMAVIAMTMPMPEDLDRSKYYSLSMTLMKMRDDGVGSRYG
jgi:hypothetical protein